MRQIIITETKKAGEGVVNIECVFWVPIAKTEAHAPRPGFVSRLNAYSGQSKFGVTADERAALEAGTVREDIQVVQASTSSPAAAIQDEILRRYKDRAALIAAEVPQRNFFGLSYDSVTGWSA